MRQLFHILLLLALLAGLSACGLFGGDDEELELAELIEFDTKLPIKKLWSVKVGMMPKRCVSH